MFCLWRIGSLVRPVDRYTVERAKSLPSDALRVGDPVFVGAGVATCGVVLIECSDFGAADLAAHLLQFVLRFYLQA